MTRVRDLDYAFTVATFDERTHPEGRLLASTAALTTTGPFTAFVRVADESFEWFSSTAMWGEDGHPWALVRRFRVDADADGAPPKRSDDPRLRGGGELRITDDLESGRAALSPQRTPARPRRVNAQAWEGDRAQPTDTLSVTVQDGISATDPATITVLDGPGFASGTTLSTEPGLASRLRATTEPVSVHISLASETVGWRQRRAAARLPQRLTIVARED